MPRSCLPSWVRCRSQAPIRSRGTNRISLLQAIGMAGGYTRIANPEQGRREAERGGLENVYNLTPKKWHARRRNSTFRYHARRRHHRCRIDILIMADLPSDKQLSELLGGGESDSASGLDFGYYLHLLLRYIWLFLAIVLICAAVGAYLALRQPQKYVRPQSFKSSSRSSAF